MSKRFQGNEFRATIQAPNEPALEKMITSMRKLAKESGADYFRVLEKGPDPDGGWVSTISAHNWNPITWLKEKIKGKKSTEGPAEEATTGLGTEVLGEDPKEVEKKEREAYEKFKKQSEKEAKIAGIKSKYATKRAEQLRKIEDIGKKEAQEEIIRQKVKDYPVWHRRGAEARIREGLKGREEADIEKWEQQVPGEVMTYTKMLQKEYWTKKGTDIPIPEPRTAEEKAEADYHPSQWVIQQTPRKLSSMEQLQLARASELDKMKLDIAREEYKQFKRERKPIYRFAKAAGGFGTFIAGTATIGAAGVARGMQPSRGGRERAVRMHAPGVPLDLYGVRPMLGVGIPPASVHTGAGLEHLRALTFPGIGRVKKQVRQVRR